MAAIITTKFRVKNASSFITSNDTRYMFIGRPQAWAEDTTPPTPVDGEGEIGSIWSDMMALKKVTASNMTHSIIKRMWTAGYFYDVYRHDYAAGGPDGVNIITGAANTDITALHEANYFVITDNYNVYICIDNNDGAASTSDPKNLTYDSHYISTNAADGYIWKFVAKASLADIIKFSTSDYHPVKTITSAPGSGDDYLPQWNAQQASEADAGALFNIELSSAGSGYGANLSANTMVCVIEGDGEGAVVSVNTDASGAITKIWMSSYGTGYTWATAVFNTGTGAVAVPIISPSAGLGADPVNDLCAFNSTINVRFEYEDGSDFPVTNDYRRVGLVINPFAYGTETLLSATTASAMGVIKVTPGTGTWVNDAVIKDSTTNAYGRVVDITDGAGADAGKKLIKIIRTSTENSLSGADGAASFVPGNTITIVSGGTATGTISAVVTPEVQPNSGIVSYIENRRPIMRASDQIEDIKVTFEW